MNKVYLGIITILAGVTICLGQTDKNASRITLISGARIDAELQKTIDVNNASIGDQVVLKTTKTIRQGGSVIVPKGTTLIGRITEVQRRTKENGKSRLGMIFERIQGNDLSTPISASIVSITNAAANVSTSGPIMSDVSGSSQTSASASRSTSGGGLLGGVGNTVGGLVNTTTQTVGTVTNTVEKTAGTTTGTVGRTLNGIQISTSASGSASSSTTLSSTNKNLRVEKGASFSLLVDSRPWPQE